MGVVLLCDIIFGIRLPLEALWSDDTLYAKLSTTSVSQSFNGCHYRSGNFGGGTDYANAFRNPLAGPPVLGLVRSAWGGVYLLAGGLLPVALTQRWGLVIAAITGAVLVLLLVLAVSLHASSRIIAYYRYYVRTNSRLVGYYSANGSNRLAETFCCMDIRQFIGGGLELYASDAVVNYCGLTIVFAIQKSLNGLLLGENYTQGLGIALPPVS